jgi:RimJ/RimL family protein N-acetyltransferase
VGARRLNAIPVIETDRLLFRAHSLDDYGAALALWSDPEVTRFIGSRPSTPQQVWMRILNYAGLWSMLGYGYWAIVEKATHRFIGEAGFADFHRDVPASMRGVPEAGWAFASAVHGHGFGVEAVTALNAWSDVALASTRTVCLIHAGNHASIHVAEKCGFVRFDQTSDLADATLFFERLR